MSNKKDLIIPAAMLEGVEDYNTEEVAKFMERVLTGIVEQFKIKDSEYDGSWQTDGLMSVHFNFKRKVDRILAQLRQGAITDNSGGTGENIADTLIDLATYTLMYAYFVKNKNKGVEEFFTGFIKKFSKDV